MDKKTLAAKFVNYIDGKIQKEYHLDTTNAYYEFLTNVANIAIAAKEKCGSKDPYNDYFTYLDEMRNLAHDGEFDFPGDKECDQLFESYSSGRIAPNDYWEQVRNTSGRNKLKWLWNVYMIETVAKELVDFNLE